MGRPVSELASESVSPVVGSTPRAGRPVSDELLRVGVIGARGRMGAQTCQAVVEAEDMDLVAAVGGREWLFSLADAGSQVVVEFTHPDVVMDHIRFCIDQNIHIITGTSGFTDERLDTIAAVARRQARTRRAGGAELRDRGGAHRPVRPRGGPVLRIRGDHRTAPRRQGRRARPAPQWRPRGRSRLARKDAGLGAVPDATTLETGGARGASVDGIRVHSVRLPGLVAHQEVIMGSAGETLTIRHDSLDRSSFMPGVLAAIRAVAGRPGLTVGLEQLLGLD